MKKQVLFLVRDQYDEEFKYSKYNHKSRFFKRALDAGFEVIISSWNNLIVNDDKVYVKWGLIAHSGKKEEQIGKLVEIHPCYINHHVNPISEDLITINKYNIDVFEFMLSKGLIENNRKSFGAISKIYVNYLIENYWNTSKFSFNPKISKLG